MGNIVAEDFVKTFHGALDKLEADAKKVGLNLTAICKLTGISRSTPDRWRKIIPTTVVRMKQMQQVVNDKEAEEKKKRQAVSGQVLTPVLDVEDDE